MPVPSGGRRRRLRRALTMSGLVAVGLVAAWFVTALVLFVLPRQQPLHEADAVIALSPPRDRLPVALDAFQDGLAPRLWVSYVPADIGTDDRALIDVMCSPDTPATACFTPLTDDTIGEARAVAELVERTGAKSVIVATHTGHAARARFLFERCLPEGTDVQMLLVEERQDLRHLFGRMVYETAAFVKAFADIRHCR